MAGIFDLLDAAPAPTAPAPTPSLGDTFNQGLRSGTIGARGSLNELAGTAMGALGLDGSGRRAASIRDQAEAGQIGSTLPQFSDINGVGSGLRWAAGAMGQSLPVSAAAIGAGVLTRGKSLGANIGAGTAAMAPFEMGEMVQRQRADPANAGLSDAQQLGNAALPALGASAIQSAVPAVVAGKILGRGAAGAGTATLRGIAGHALADIPAEGLAEAGGEGIRQFGLNQTNPNAGYDVEAIKQAGYQGAALGGALGGVGAAGDIAHKYAGAAIAAPGRALDAAKGLVPDSIKQRAGEAMGAAEAGFETGKDAVKEADIPGKLREHWEGAKAKGNDWLERMANGDETADPAELAAAGDDLGKQAEIFDKADRSAMERAAAWVEELSNDNLGPEKTALLKKAGANLADKANQKIVAGLKRAKDAGQDAVRAVDRFVNKPAQAGDVVGEATEVPEVPDRPRLGVKKSEISTEKGKELTDAISGVLGADRLEALAKPIKTKGADGKVTTRIPLNDLAAGLRPFMDDVANGKAFSSFDKLDQLTALYDIAGDNTSALLNAVHGVVRSSDKNDAAVFRALNQIDQIQQGRQGVMETLQKNLLPQFARSANQAELRTEMAMVEKWARQDTAQESPKPSGKAGPQQPIGMSPDERKFKSAQVRRALQTRYGDKADLVYDAIEANMRVEKNMIDGESKNAAPLDSDTAGVEKREAGQTISADPKDKGEREGSVDEFKKAQYKYFPQSGQLYMDPTIDDNPSPFGTAAEQRMKKATKENPNAVTRFMKVSELDQGDPKVAEMVKSKREALAFEAKSNGLKGAEADAWVEKHIDKFGLVVAEQSKESTQFTRGEIDSTRLDAKKHGKSPSRIDVDKDTILDAVRIVRMMSDKMKGDYTEFDDKGPAYRTARMFVEGVAAAQDQLGKSFNIDDATVIQNKFGNLPQLTWGDAKKLLKPEGKSSPLVKAKNDAGEVIGVPGSAKIDSQVTRLQHQMDAITKPTSDRLISKLKRQNALTKATAREAFRQAEETHWEELAPLKQKIGQLLGGNLGDDTAGRQGADATGFEGDVERGINTDKKEVRENIHALSTKIAEVGRLLDGESQFGQGPAEVKLRQQLGLLNNELTAMQKRLAGMTPGEDLGSGRTEIDPFGPTFDVLGGKDIPDAQIRTNSDGSPRAETVMGRRQPARPAPGATKLDPIMPSTGPKNDIGEGEEAPITKGRTLGTPIVQMAKAMAKGGPERQALSKKLFALIDSNLDPKDEVALEAVTEVAAPERDALINSLASKYQVDEGPESIPDSLPLSSLFVEREAVHETSGKKTKIKQRADEALADVDQQTKSLEGLIKCLRS